VWTGLAEQEQVHLSLQGPKESPRSPHRPRPLGSFLALLVVLKLTGSDGRC
jgi:hypothetical protein